MIYLRLFLEFLKIGAFTFGGGYAAVPLIRETVLSNGWLDDAMLSDLIAVSESTPGPIMVNLDLCRQHAGRFFGSRSRNPRGGSPIIHDNNYSDKGFA